VYADGSIYVGALDKGMKSGQGRVSYMAGAEYFGAFKQGLRHGYGAMVVVSTQRAEADYRDALVRKHPFSEGDKAL
jgi:hypothetical protein